MDLDVAIRPETPMLAVRQIDVHPHTTNDDMLISYYVEFDRDTPETLLEKISGLSGYAIHLSAIIFDISYNYEQS